MKIATGSLPEQARVILANCVAGVLSPLLDRKLSSSSLFVSTIHNIQTISTDYFKVVSDGLKSVNIQNYMSFSGWNMVILDEDSSTPLALAEIIWDSENRLPYLSHFTTGPLVQWTCDIIQRIEHDFVNVDDICNIATIKFPALQMNALRFYTAPTSSIDLFAVHMTELNMNLSQDDIEVFLSMLAEKGYFENRMYVQYLRRAIEYYKYLQSPGPSEFPESDEKLVNFP